MGEPVRTFERCPKGLNPTCFSSCQFYDHRKYGCSVCEHEKVTLTISEADWQWLKDEYAETVRALAWVESAYAAQGRRARNVQLEERYWKARSGILGRCLHMIQEVRNG